MSETTKPQKTIVVPTAMCEPLTLHLGSSDPVTIRLEVDASCRCSKGATAPGSYTYIGPKA